MFASPKYSAPQPTDLSLRVPDTIQSHDTVDLRFTGPFGGKQNSTANRDAR